MVSGPFWAKISSLLTVLDKTWLPKWINSATVAKIRSQIDGEDLCAWRVLPPP